MSGSRFKSWQSIRNEVIRRIETREWSPGQFIPKEADLAEELGCARATVNRALRELASQGVLDRRRKAGTRVSTQSIQNARLKIPVIRLEVEQHGGKYGYQLLASKRKKASPRVRAILGLSSDARVLHIESLHYSNGAPLMYEDRWVCLDSVPEIEGVDLTKVSANEWLVEHAPFTTGDIAFSSILSRAKESSVLSISVGEPLFLVERSTFLNDRGITFARQLFAPGYRMQTAI